MSRTVVNVDTDIHIHVPILQAGHQLTADAEIRTLGQDDQEEKPLIERYDFLRPVRFDTSQLRVGDITASRSQTGFGKAIRMTLGCYTNHNGIVVFHEGRWYVAEAIKPVSILTPIEEYERLTREEGVSLRIFRLTHPAVTSEVRQKVAQYVIDNLLDKPYPKAALRLWVYRFVNSLPWKIEGEWCTRLTWDPYEALAPGCLDTPEGDKKKNPTPRTYENRLAAGVVKDVSCSVLTIDRDAIHRLRMMGYAVGHMPGTVVAPA